MAILAVLTFLTVAYLYLRGRYLASPLGEYRSQSSRERMLRASEILQSKGFRILDERISHEVETYFGARKTHTYLVVDFLVEKDGVHYPVKVSSTRDPDRLSGAWLRKQLLPLYTLYEAPVAYVEPDAGTLELVEFSLDFPVRYYRRRWRIRIVWLMVGVVIGWLLSGVH